MRGADHRHHRTGRRGPRWLGTFHSIAAQILRRHAELVGLKSSFTIIDVDDQERLIKQLLEAENIDSKRWTPRHFAGLIDHWKNRGWTPDRLPPAEGAHFANNRGAEALRDVPGAPAGAERLRLRRPAAAQPDHLHVAPGRAGRLPPPLPLHPGRRVPGLQRRPVPVAAAARTGPPEPLLRRRRRPVDLRLARRRGGQHSQVRARLSGRQGGPPGAQLPLHRPHPRRRLRPDRRQQGPARQDAVDRGRERPEGAGARGLGRRGREPADRRRDRALGQGQAPLSRGRHPGARLVPDAGVRRALRDAADPLPGDRRPALLRAGRDPRRPRLPAAGAVRGRRPGVRAHRQRPQARHRRDHGAEAAGGGPRRRRLGRHRGARADPHRRAGGAHPHRAGRLPARPRSLGRGCRRQPRIRACWRPSSRRAATPMRSGSTKARPRRPGSTT